MTKTKIFTILTIMIIIFLVGCKKEEDTPPPFGAPPVERMMRGFTGTVPEGFGVPVDVFNNDEPIIKEIPPLTADPTDKIIPTVTASVSQPGGWVWKEGYRYDWSTKTWVKYVFPQNAYGTTNWIKATASTSLSDILYNSVALDVKEDAEGGNLILAFTCKRYSGEWKCGCTTTTETAPCAKWMARKYAVNTELPPVKDPGVPPNLYVPQPKLITLVGYAGTDPMTADCQKITSNVVTVSSCQQKGCAPNVICPTSLGQSAISGSQPCGAPGICNTCPGIAGADYLKFTLNSLPIEDGKLEIISGERARCQINGQQLPQQDVGQQCGYQFPIINVPKTMFKLGENTLYCEVEGEGDKRWSALKVSHFSFTVME